MLTRLLALIREGNLHTPSEFAEALGTSPELVRAMLADLERKGLLATPASTCSGGCSHCKHGAGCSLQSSHERK
jgi:DNA-binding IscR family transcriptional regulator